MKKPSLLTLSVSPIIGHLSLSFAFPDGYLQALNVLLNKKRCVLSDPCYLWHRFSLSVVTKSEQTLECVIFYPESMMLSTEMSADKQTSQGAIGT